MAFWNSHKSPLEKDDEEWQLACWPWLLKHVVDPDWIRSTPLILPTDEFFPPTQAHGKERAEHVFKCVCDLTGVADWPFDLVEQDQAVNPVLAQLAVVQNAPVSPLGTFYVKPNDRLQVTYNPALVDEPVQLIATFAHEVSHALMLMVDRSSPDTELPGGWICEEFATDLLVVLLGFGLFGANSAFQFQQMSDPATGMQGWSTSKSGYLTEAEWAFALAVYLKVTDQPADALMDRLKPGLVKQLSKSVAYLDRNDELLVWIES